MYHTESPLKITYVSGAILFAHYYFSLKSYKKLMVVSFLALILTFPYMIGVVVATQKEDFYYIEGEEKIILDLINDKAIIAKVDIKKRVMYPEYELKKIESTDKEVIKFKLITIKNLKISKEEVYY